MIADAKGEELRDLGLDVPVACALTTSLRQKGWDIPICLTPNEAARAIARCLEARHD